ncbi:MAG: ACP S-malonyltransferase [Myxococcota bacterium]
MTQRALVVCPGRGSYGREQLGSLQHDLAEARAVIDACDAWRETHGQPTVRELDAAERYQAKRHVAGEHASLLTFAVTMVDLAHIDRDRYDVVGVTGNSMGWYTALAAAGALSLPHAIELVDTMGSYQAGNVIGGQVMMPVVDGDWAPDRPLREAIDAAMDQVRGEGHTVEVSIELGSFVVLGADTAGVKRLLAVLPPQKRGSRTFPVQLPLHSAFHTSLLEATSQRARQELAHLEFRTPGLPLFDGHGRLHRPWSTDPEALADYTLGAQVTETYDFATALQRALRHCAPDVVIALGPGNSLGGPCAWGLVREGWQGVRERSQLRAAGVLRSFGVAEQRRDLVA